MSERFVRKPFRLTSGMVVGSFLVALCLCLVSGAGLWEFSAAPAAPFEPPVAVITILPAPTSTPSPSPTPTLATTPSPAAPGQGIAIGAYVQISGTGGQGLRLRAAPGLAAALLFLGYDAEVYQVRDGPRQADGYTWWYLVAPYDEGRAGWAAADFLSVLSTPQP